VLTGADGRDMLAFGLSRGKPGVAGVRWCCFSRVLVYNGGMRSALATVALALLLPSAVMAAEIEGFDGGVFTNARLVHHFEFENCCWAITDELEPGNYALHLDPNTDEITFDGFESVTSIQVRVFDTEGGFAGVPSSAVIARGAGGDFAFRNAAELETWDTVTITSDDLGQLTGLPIGPIVSISFQASNENYGAYFDDILLELPDACYADFDGSGSLDLFDFLAFTNAFNTGDKVADCAPDGVLDLFDFLCFVNAFNLGC
jgi:hypothetical protein